MNKTSTTAMRGTSASKKNWKKDSLEFKVLQGRGIDIGAGDDPVFSDVKSFDKKDGDANFITKYINEKFDFVYSSHCLEHMHNPKEAVLEWWELVKEGGYLFFTVPDEDLYEQGVFPSQFNSDHKATFTLSKKSSWSPVSINVYDLAKSLPKGDIVSLCLQDDGYDRSFLTFGKRRKDNFLIAFFSRVYFFLKRKTSFSIRVIDFFFLHYYAVDQTRKENVLAQIQCIVRKNGVS